MRMIRKTHSVRVIERLRSLSSLREVDEDDERWAEFCVTIQDLKHAIRLQFREFALVVRLWLAGWHPRRRLVGNIGLRAHGPGGNAYDRRQYWRHPVRHSRIHLWYPAFVPYKG